MSVTRSGNWLGQMRVDVPDIRAIESAVCNDFDLLAGKIMNNELPYVVRGFTIQTQNTVGTPAVNLTLNVASGLVMHYGATEAGTLLQVAADRSTELLNSGNDIVSGNFAASTTNYVGLDYTRAADEATSDITKFLDPNTESETTRRVPKARVLDYTIIIGTAPFSFNTNICPVAIVVTDSSNNVVSITDARQGLFRLGRGGDVPNAYSSYTWSDTTRRENNNTYSASSTADPFAGGDKNILCMKDWMSAVMSVLWEAKSGESWYSPTSRDLIKVAFSPSLLGNGTNFDWDLGSSTLEWSGILVAFENSSGSYYNTVTDDDAVINDGQCLYVDIDRTTSPAATIVAQVGSLQSLPTPTIPGSRLIIAWRLDDYIYVRDYPFDVGRPVVNAATTTTDGVVQLNATPADAVHPEVITVGVNGTAVSTATAGNTAGLTTTGFGSGSGVVAVGGASGYGVAASGGAGGITAVGGATSFGIETTGGNGGISALAGAGAPAVLASGGSAAPGVYSTGGSGSGDGVYAQGTGTGRGIHAIAGTGGANGILAEGRLTGAGVAGVGGLTGAGVAGTGGATSGAGVTGIGGAAAGIGVVGTGTGGSTGVSGTGNGSGAGVTGIGGASNGYGVTGTGGASDGVGVRGVGGSTNGAGVHGIGTGSGVGVFASSVTGVALSVQSDLTSPVRAAFHMEPQNAQPTGPNEIGDMYVTSAGVLKICTVAGSPGTWISVGAQV